MTKRDEIVGEALRLAVEHIEKALGAPMPNGVGADACRWVQEALADHYDELVAEFGKDPDAPPAPEPVPEESAPLFRLTGSAQPTKVNGHLIAPGSVFEVRRHPVGFVTMIDGIVVDILPGRVCRLSYWTDGQGGGLSEVR